MAQNRIESTAEAPTILQRTGRLLSSALISNFTIYTKVIGGDLVRKDPKMPHVILWTQVPGIVEKPVNFALRISATIINIAGKFIIPTLHIGALSGIYEATTHQSKIFGDIGKLNDILLYLDKWDNPPSNELNLILDNLYKTVAWVDNLPRTIQEIFYKGPYNTNVVEALSYDRLMSNDGITPLLSASQWTITKFFQIASATEDIARNLVQTGINLPNTPDFIYSSTFTPVLHYTNIAIDAINSYGEKYHGTPLAIGLLTVTSMVAVRYLRSGVKQAKLQAPKTVSISNKNTVVPQADKDSEIGIEFKKEFETVFKGGITLSDLENETEILSLLTKYNDDIANSRIPSPTLTSILTELHNISKVDATREELRKILKKIGTN